MNPESSPRQLPAVCFAFVLAAASSFFGVSAADAPGVAPKPYTPPFPELPPVLWFEDFENGASVATGGAVSDAPDVPGGKAYGLGEANITGQDKKGGTVLLELGQTQVTVPGGSQPGATWVSFSLWTEDAGDLDITAQGAKEKFVFKVPVKTAKKWMPVTFKLSDMGKTSGNTITKLPMTAEETITRFQMLFIPLKNTFQKAYIDDVLITQGAKPTDVLPAIRAARKTVKEAERSLAKDGFTFSQPFKDTVKAALALKPPRKSRLVAVIAPRPADSSTAVKALTSAATKAKFTDYTFAAASGPESTAIGGLDDMRLLGKSAVDQSQAQFVILMLGYKDAATSADSVRVVVDRLLRSGCIPIVSIPPLSATLAQPEKGVYERFASSVSDVCKERGIVAVEASAALKSANEPAKDGELSPAGLDAVGTVLVAALKHLDSNAIKHR